MLLPQKMISKTPRLKPLRQRDMKMVRPKLSKRSRNKPQRHSRTALVRLILMMVPFGETLQIPVKENSQRVAVSWVLITGSVLTKKNFLRK